MKTKLVQALGLALVAVLLVTTVAAADQGSGSGTGTLTAKGNGFAAMRGKLSVTISGTGLLVIQDAAGDAKIKVSGKGFKRVFKNGVTVYGGFDGEAKISGSKISVALGGSDIELEASGTGKFFLRGNGSYHTDHDNGAWSKDGKVVTLP